MTVTQTVTQIVKRIKELTVEATEVGKGEEARLHAASVACGMLRSALETGTVVLMDGRLLKSKTRRRRKVA